jgi:hypothetical protein
LFYSLILRDPFERERPGLRKSSRLPCHSNIILNDTDIGVKKRAIRCLSGIKSNIGLEKFLEILKKAEDFPSDKDLQLESSLFSALGFYGNVEMPEIVSFLVFLIETLDRLRKTRGQRLDQGPLTYGFEGSLVTRIKLPRPISGGLLLSYRCTAECRHCMYACSPKWSGDWVL